MRLDECFERIIVIALPGRRDRLNRLHANLEQTGICKPERVRWQRAVDGAAVGAPAWWNAGDGAWGCLLSHTRVMQDAIHDAVESVLILEDDAVFLPEAEVVWARFWSGLPRGWGQVYAGGQHLARPRPLPEAPEVMRCWNVNRTHAYAVSREALPAVHAHVMHAPDYQAHPQGWHIDWQLGLAHRRGDWDVYAPTWWICGQAGGNSDISGKHNPDMWWQPNIYTQHLPFVRIPETPTEEQARRVRRWLHLGNHLKAGTLEDVGLDPCVDDRPALNRWMRMVAREAGDVMRLPGLQHPDIDRAQMEAAWGPPVMELDDAPVKEWSDYPWNGLFSHPLAGARPTAPQREVAG